MSASIASAAERRPAERRLTRSVFAVLGPLVANALASGVTDQLFHMLGVYPPWGVPMHETSDNLLALSYRLVYGVLGAWLVARLAPHAPTRHALVYGAIGTTLSLAGAYVAIAHYALGPAWYPLLLAATALPCSRLGASLHGRRYGTR